MRLKPWELDQFSPHEFFNAVIGMGDQDLKQWEHTRFISWSAIVAQRGSEKIPTPKDLLALPTDGPMEIDRGEINEIFKEVQEKWTAFLPPESEPT